LSAEKRTTMLKNITGCRQCGLFMSRGSVLLRHIAEVHTNQLYFCSAQHCPKDYANYNKYLVRSHEKHCKGFILESTTSPENEKECVDLEVCAHSKNSSFIIWQ
jgi:hypothetical protein